MEGELQRVVGRNLRRWRQHRKLSQEAFADVLGYHRTFMGGLERGERNLTLKTVERIAAKLQVHPLALLMEPEPTGPVDATEQPRTRRQGPRTGLREQPQEGGAGHPNG